jgi:hypothetical protein
MTSLKGFSLNGWSGVGDVDRSDYCIGAVGTGDL